MPSIIHELIIFGGKNILLSLLIYYFGKVQMTGFFCFKDVSLYGKKLSSMIFPVKL